MSVCLCIFLASRSYRLREKKEFNPTISVSSLCFIIFPLLLIFFPFLRLSLPLSLSPLQCSAPSVARILGSNLISCHSDCDICHLFSSFHLPYYLLPSSRTKSMSGGRIFLSNQLGNLTHPSPSPPRFSCVSARTISTPSLTHTRMSRHAKTNRYIPLPTIPPPSVQVSSP